ncbi:hypothetical protein ABH931_002553 [Streptacidiphilus sp. MAP12-33]|uniref:FtsX-like permease family protein n=1 Tax=Streptacidiphilus sp. MAP12-33 TaxID=3156266 RepID=UPI003515D951
MLGFVGRRLRGRLPLTVAMLLTVLITTTVLTSLQAFGRSVGDAAVRRALAGPGHDRTTVLVSGDQGIGQRAGEDAAVAAFAHTLFGRFPVSVETVARSRSYGLPGAPSSAGSDADLTRLAALAPDRVKLLDGRLPKPVSGPGAVIEVAVPRAEATRLRLDVKALPARVRLADRYGGAPLTVTVTGVYRAVDSAAPYWGLDPFGGREMELNGFANFGPMLVDDTVFTTRAVPEDGRSWLLDPGLSTAGATDLQTLAARVDTASTDLQRGTSLTVQTDLGTELEDLSAGAQSAWADELIGLLQLALLAVVALLLVVQLVNARQAPEDALLAARGATRRRLGLLTAGQALLLALPAALLAPPLTPPLLRLLNRSYGPLAQVRVDSSLTWRSWLVAGVCAAACVVLTAAPALLRGATSGLLRRAGARQALVGGAARSGADLALIALAVLAYQELDQHGTGAGSGLGIDPVAVAAPTLVLCAGTVVVLRLLPHAARLGGLLAARGSGLPAALVGWQLSRRPGRTTGPTLLLVLAVSTGVLALGQHASWNLSQSDQASFATADGLRIWGSTLPALGQGGRFGALPDGDRILPVTRTQVTLPGGGEGELLAVDAAGVSARLRIRSDLLSGQSEQALFAPLTAPVPHGASAGIPLPGRPARIDVRVHLNLATFTDDPQPYGGVAVSAAEQPGPAVLLQLRDRFGAVHVVPLSYPPLQGDATLTADLSGLAGAPMGSIAWPLTLSGIQIQLTPIPGVSVSGELALNRVAVAATGSGTATAVAVPTGFAWSPYNAVDPGLPEPPKYPPLALQPGPGLVQAQYSTADEPVNATLTPVGATTAPTDGQSSDQAPPLAALATPGYLSAVGAKVGDVVPFAFGGTTVPLRITGEPQAVPTAPDAALVVDLASLDRRLAQVGTLPPEPTEWWLPAASAQDRGPARAAAALRSAPGTQNLALHEEATAQLTDDPLGAGPQVTLLVLAVVAAILAAIGFAAATAAAASERAREHAVLHALGCSRKALARAAAAEPAVLIALGTAVGLAVGALIVRLVVPLVVLTPTAQRPVPPVQVSLPFGQTAALVAAITVVPVLTAFLSGRRSAATRTRPLEEL